MRDFIYSVLFGYSIGVVFFLGLTLVDLGRQKFLRQKFFILFLILIWPISAVVFLFMKLTGRLG